MWSIFDFSYLKPFAAFLENILIDSVCYFILCLFWKYAFSFSVETKATKLQKNLTFCRVIFYKNLFILIWGFLEIQNITFIMLGHRIKKPFPKSKWYLFCQLPWTVTASYSRPFLNLILHAILSFSLYWRFELNGLEVILDNFRSIFPVTLRRFDCKPSLNFILSSLTLIS